MNANLKFWLNRIFSIFLTALIGAILSTLQTLYVQHTNSLIPATDPVSVAGLGASLRVAYQMYYYS